MMKFLWILGLFILGTVSFYSWAGSPLVNCTELPSAQKMNARLINVLNEKRLRAEYYPLLLQYAGTKQSPEQVVDLFDQATEQFLGGLSESESRLVRVQLVPYIKPYIQSVLKDDPEAAQKAIAIHQQTNRPPRVLGQ